MTSRKKRVIWIVAALVSIKIILGIAYVSGGKESFDWNFLGVALAQFDEKEKGKNKSFELNIEVSRALEKKKEELEKKEKAITEKEERLSLIENSIRQRVEELAKIQKNVEKLIVKRDELEESSVQHLAKIYKGMDPQEAATQIGKLKHAVAIKVFTRMKSKTASQIMPFLAPKLAKRFGEEIVLKRLMAETKKKK